MTRTLVGQPGITYKYLGLRMFAHPWSERQDAAAREGSEAKMQRREKKRRGAAAADAAAKVAAVQSGAVEIGALSRTLLHAGPAALHAERCGAHCTVPHSSNLGHQLPYHSNLRYHVLAPLF
eukprot:SAG31_NODE_3740_length_3932_cov_3.662145_5_plen_122_part_00